MINNLNFTVIWINIFFFFMFTSLGFSAHVICFKPQGNVMVEPALTVSKCMPTSSIITKVASHTYPLTGDNSFPECGNSCKDIPFS